MEAALISVSMGMFKPLLSKLTHLVEKEYVELTGVHKQIEFLRDELSAISPALRMLADAEQLNPQMKDWRDKLRELADDMEDCVDDFVAFVEQDQHYGLATGFKRV